VQAESSGCSGHSGSYGVGIRDQNGVHIIHLPAVNPPGAVFLDAAFDVPFWVMPVMCIS